LRRTIRWAAQASGMSKMTFCGDGPIFTEVSSGGRSDRWISYFFFFGSIPRG